MKRKALLTFFLMAVLGAIVGLVPQVVQGPMPVRADWAVRSGTLEALVAEADAVIDGHVTEITAGRTEYGEDYPGDPTDVVYFTTSRSTSTTCRRTPPRASGATSRSRTWVTTITIR